MSRASILSFVVFLTACSAYQAQKNEIRQNDSAHSKSNAAVPAAPAADLETVRRFERHALNRKQATLVSQLDLYKSELEAEGKYACCVSPGCNECPLRDGECHCKHAVAASGPCCGECTAAWIDGRGDIPGIDKEQVLASLGCVRELYEKKIPETAATPAPAASPAPQHHH